MTRAGPMESRTVPNAASVEAASDTSQVAHAPPRSSATRFAASSLDANSGPGGSQSPRRCFAEPRSAA